uniref:Uncharacterized protein n=1 Tax=Pipistrellus kuhlii TaxID=59472 RepID=A0A7J7V675_PIPKU|nr:hypothetical protein mPipKuh1_008555 [Pipistrellus kuhlii]
MEDLLRGVKVALEVVVGHLYRAAVLFVEHLAEAPQSLARDIPLCALAVVLLIWKRCVLQRKREVARWFTAQMEEDREAWQNLELTQACEWPAEGACPLGLQTLSLCSVEPQEETACGLDFLSEDSDSKEETSELLGLPFPRGMPARPDVQMRLLKGSSTTTQGQVPETKKAFQVSQKNIALVEKEMLDPLVKITIPGENMQLFSQEAAKCSEGAWEMREEQQACVKIQVNE